MKIQGLPSKNIYKLAMMLLLCLKLSHINAQEVDIDNTNQMKNSFYIDFSTKGAYYSINYDRVFYQKKINFSYHVGFSILPDEIAIPVGINLFFGQKNSYAEFGLSIMPYVYKYQTFFSDDDVSDKYFYITPTFGYRFQKPNKGIFFKVAVSPMIVLDPPSNDFWRMDPRLYFAANMSVGFVF